MEVGGDSDEVYDGFILLPYLDCAFITSPYYSCALLDAFQFN